MVYPNQNQPQQQRNQGGRRRRNQQPPRRLAFQLVDWHARWRDDNNIVVSYKLRLARGNDPAEGIVVDTSINQVQCPGFPVATDNNGIVEGGIVVSPDVRVCFLKAVVATNPDVSLQRALDMGDVAKAKPADPNARQVAKLSIETAGGYDRKQTMIITPLDDKGKSVPNVDIFMVFPDGTQRKINSGPGGTKKCCMTVAKRIYRVKFRIESPNFLIGEHTFWSDVPFGPLKGPAPQRQFTVHWNLWNMLGRMNEEKNTVDWAQVPVTGLTQPEMAQVALMTVVPIIIFSFCRLIGCTTGIVATLIAWTPPIMAVGFSAVAVALLVLWVLRRVPSIWPGIILLAAATVGYEAGFLTWIVTWVPTFLCWTLWIILAGFLVYWLRRNHVLNTHEPSVIVAISAAITFVLWATSWFSFWSLVLFWISLNALFSTKYWAQRGEWMVGRWNRIWLIWTLVTMFAFGQLVTSPWGDPPFRGQLQRDRVVATEQLSDLGLDHLSERIINAVSGDRWVPNAQLNYAERQARWFALPAEVPAEATTTTETTMTEPTASWSIMVARLIAFVTCLIIWLILGPFAFADEVIRSLEESMIAFRERRKQQVEKKAETIQKIGPAAAGTTAAAVGHRSGFLAWALALNTFAELAELVLLVTRGVRRMKGHHGIMAEATTAQTN